MPKFITQHLDSVKGGRSDVDIQSLLSLPDNTVLFQESLNPIFVVPDFDAFEPATYGFNLELKPKKAGGNLKARMEVDVEN